MNTFKVSARAKKEIAEWRLDTDPLYVQRVNYYIYHYEQRPPARGRNMTNMLAALRMLKWRNTPDDWARLHVTEVYLRKLTQKQGVR